MMTRARARLAGTNQGGNAETRLRPYRGRGFFVFFGLPETLKGSGSVPIGPPLGSGREKSWEERGMNHVNEADATGRGAVPGGIYSG
ncbi:hypothetical protein [Paenibacillus sp. cl141a]|uniref:hypothetical protein n=1 Tax=Paenibacillus sp. cl141a TaxID=1761877 RepID=UPI001C313166|nr:hypothetical protein [Paenibacillus sp. cl141a]